MEVCFETLGLPPPRQLPSDDENCCSVTTSSTKTTIFSTADDAFSFSQWRNLKNLIDKEMLFNYLLSRRRRVTECVFDLWIIKLRTFANRVIS